MTECVYKLKNGKVISTYADEKGNILMTKEAFEIMSKSWKDGYQQGRADAIDEVLKLPKHNHYDNYNDLMYQSIRVEDIKCLKE